MVDDTPTFMGHFIYDDRIPRVPTQVKQAEHGVEFHLACFKFKDDLLCSGLNVPAIRSYLRVQTSSNLFLDMEIMMFKLCFWAKS